MTETGRDAPQRKISRQERLVGALDSWQKVVLALTALVLAVGGLIAAGLKVAHTMQPSAAGERTSHAAVPGLALPGAGQSSAPVPTAKPGTQLGPSQSLYVQDFNFLNYSSATGTQPAFEYFAVLRELYASGNVNLAVLDPPAPTASAAYAACQNDGSYTKDIKLDSLAPGSGLCVFTPNQQILWITFLPVDQNSQSTALHVSVLTWQGPTS